MPKVWPAWGRSGKFWGLVVLVVGYCAAQETHKGATCARCAPPTARPKNGKSSGKRKTKSDPVGFGKSFRVVRRCGCGGV